MKAVCIIATFIIVSFAVPAFAEERVLPRSPAPKIEVTKPVAKKVDFFHDKQVWALAAVEAGAFTVDIASTVMWERQGLCYTDTGIPFRGHRPGVLALAADGAVEVFAAAYLAHKMHQSGHKWLRALSVVPQSVLIGTHSVAAGRNYRSF